MGMIASIVIEKYENKMYTAAQKYTDTLILPTV